MTLLDTPSAATVHPVTGTVGAEISGVRLGPDLPAEAVTRIRQTLLERKVVFFRDQHHLDEDGQIGFARLLGRLTGAHPTVPAGDDTGTVLPVDGSASRANQWHTDVTFVDRPPAFSLLRAVTLPDAGGDTVWADTTQAYARLPEPLKALADRLRAVHTNAHDYARPVPPEGSAERQHFQQFVAEVFETEHPVVRVHPETGERTLLLGGFVRSFVGLGARDFAALFPLLQDRITRPENLVRWSWRPGDVAVFDNRATQHYAVDDYGSADRRLRRVTVAGDLPVGVDGQPSIARRGDASDYARAA
ncbi:TauD/TfdA dioxygenase family protein [Trujillonella endophytica]|uniref:Taurine dioxygenase n=1 Tax=Trujillonella endophytica TaxID=673521 RepID=A0A1H8TKQ2_9ACTN|nr:TauD/TfdA family dioxygenase [Trujillella endophytica]SEO91552.1 taurine dioxygenase [Trujillella endophytica]